MVDILYERSNEEFKRGNFRIKGDTLDIFVAYDDFIYRIMFWGDEIESIYRIDPLSGKKISSEKSILIYPANLFVTNKDVIDLAIDEIGKDLEKQVSFLKMKEEFVKLKELMKD